MKIHAGATFSGTRIVIGDGTYIGYGAFFDGVGPIQVGRNCNLAQRVSVHCVTHEIGPASKRAGARRELPTVIEDGVWVGAGATILPGVRVGTGCIIAAGAVVTQDCAPDGLYGGVPARRLRELDGEQDRAAAGETV